MQILRESISMGAEEDESSIGRVWAARFHHITARPRLALVLKLMNRLCIYLIFNFWGAAVTADTESVNTGAHLLYWEQN
jgi:hypothetical protein